METSTPVPKGGDKEWFCNECGTVVGKGDDDHKKHDVVEHANSDILTSEIAQLEKTLNNIKIVAKKNEMDNLIDQFKTALSFEDLENGSLNESIRSLKEAENDRTIKVATWNVKNFSSKIIHDESNKISLVCATILAENFDLIVLQEVGESQPVGINSENSAISKLQVMLNENSQDQWIVCTTETRIGKIYQGVTYGVFLWRNSSGIEINSTIATLEGDYTRQPVTITCTVRNFVFSLVSVHLKQRGDNPGKQKNNEEIATLHRLVTDFNGKVKPDSILLGHFNNYVPSIAEYSEEYQNVLGLNEYTNTANDSCYDGIIMHKTMKNERYSKHGVSEIQTEDTIEESDVSCHRPVWVELKYKPKETDETEETESEQKKQQ